MALRQKIVPHTGDPQHYNVPVYIFKSEVIHTSVGYKPQYISSEWI